MSDHISSEQGWPSYKVKRSHLAALAPFCLGLGHFPAFLFIHRGWAGRGRGEISKDGKRDYPKASAGTWTEDCWKSTQPRPGYSLSPAEIPPYVSKISQCCL